MKRTVNVYYNANSLNENTIHNHAKQVIIMIIITDVYILYNEHSYYSIYQKVKSVTCVLCAYSLAEGRFIYMRLVPANMQITPN